MSNREELNEEAAATIAVAELVRTRRTWGDLLEPQKDEYRRVASAALAVFEKSQAPTEQHIDKMPEVHPDAWMDYNKHRFADTATVMIAALNAWHQDVMPVNRLGVFGTQKEDLMRAALKAAFTAGQEEQS